MMIGTSEEARRAEMKEFMEAKYGANSALVDLKILLLKNILLAAVNRILSVHKALQFLTEDFHAYLIENQAERSPLGFQVQLSGRLSDSETSRIHRAFYRVEVLGNLYRRRYFGYIKTPLFNSPKIVNEFIPGFRDFSCDHGYSTAHPFCARFTAWENEEIACIRDYMQSRLRRCCKTTSFGGELEERGRRWKCCT